MSSLSGRVYVCGYRIPDIRILDLTTLDEIDRIPTETNKLRRLVSFDSETNSFVVSGYADDEYFVSLFDSATKECLGRINDVVGVYGLESLSSFSLSSNPIIVCGGREMVCAYDILSENESKCLLEFENPPIETIRICCFPEWSNNEVFVGGCEEDDDEKGLYRYDVNQGGVRLGSYVSHVSSHRSYVNGITASLSDGILISASNDLSFGTLNLWSKDSYGCIQSVTLDNHCFSLMYSSNSHLICCRTKKEIEIWDIRNMKKRVREVQNVGNYLVNECVEDLDQIPSQYSSSFSNDSLFVSGCKTTVSMWKANTGKVLQKCELEVFGCGGISSISGVRILSLESQEMASVDQTSLSVIHQFEDLCSFQLRCDSSSPIYELPVFLSLLSSSPYVTTDTNSLSLDRSYILIGEEGFFSVLFGLITPSPESLSQYYSLFRELHLFGFAYSICELIRSTVTKEHIEGLVDDCVFEQSTNADSDLHSLFSPFELELLQHIHDLKSIGRLSVNVWNRLRRNKADAMVALTDVELLPSFRDHAEFRSAFSNSTPAPRTVAEASKRNLRSLLTSRKLTNVTLTTADGGEERCHLEVLIARSNFFRQMMHFEGVEYHSYLETKTIRVEDLSHAALQWWLVLCYGSEFHEMDQFSVYDLLSLLVKSHMHRESWCRRLIDLLQQEMEKMKSRDVDSILLEIGSLLLKVPKLYQDQIKGFLRQKSGNVGSFDEQYENAMNYSQKLQEAAYEAERLREESLDVRDVLLI